MKIIQVTASYKPAYIYGGPIQSVGKLCEGLSKVSLEFHKQSKGSVQQDNCSRAENIEVEVFTTTANGKTELAIESNAATDVEGVRLRYFRRITKDHTHFSPALLWVLRREILRSALNDKVIIHIHAWWNLVSIFSCFVAKWYKVPVVLSPRGMLTSYTQGNRHAISKKIIHALIGKSLLKYCHIHATSELEKADILKIIEPKSITVISNLVNMEGNEYRVASGKEPDGEAKEYQVASIKYQDLEQKGDRVSGIEYQDKGNKKEETSEPFKLIFLSRIEEKKGLELVFESLTKLGFPWKLTIAGSGNEQYISDLKLLTIDLGISNKIEWLGHVADKGKFTLMSQNDLLILTSYNENFANVVIESLSVGTPVLVSEQVGLAEYVKENDLGWISSLTSLCIYENLISAYLDEKKRKEIQLKAASIIRKDFNDDALIGKYVALYNTIIHGRL